jgi:3-oxoacyl-[acyl-carrier protein] reductase
MTEIDLTGKIALVTGGAEGIGKACAHTLAQAGAQVVIADINEEGARLTADTLPGGKAHHCDLADPQSIRELTERLQTETGSVDILVSCAGIISYRKGIGEVSPEEWDNVLNVNLRSAYMLCRELIKGMKSKRYGKIVHFSSLAARQGAIEAGIHYAASKAGLIGLVRTLAKEAAPFQITVNAVAPGIIATETVLKQIADHEDAYIKTIPLGRLGDPKDVANVVLFLCSPLSDYLTGLTIDVNGGMYMG